MTGTLGLFSLVDLFQLIAASSRTGRLNIHREDGQAKIYFDKGRVVHAELNDVIGNEAVYALFADERGSFDFQVGVSTVHKSVTLSTENLVLEGIRRLDEANVKPEAPEVALDRVPAFIDNAFDVGKLTFQSYELSVLGKIDGRNSVEEIAKQLEISPLEVNRVIERLLRMGVLKLRVRKPRTARLVVSVTRHIRLNGTVGIAPNILASWEKVLGYLPEQVICRKPNGELLTFPVMAVEEAGPYLMVSHETLLRTNLTANMPLLVKPVQSDK